MTDLRSVAVTIGDIRQPGAAGYPDKILMVPYKLAQDRIDEFVTAQDLVLKENAKLSKEIERLRIENGRLREHQEQPHVPHISGDCHR